MVEINLMENYPRTKRNIDGRAECRPEEDIQIAKQFGREYFDGPRTQGYGGYQYHPRFWTDVVQDFIDHYRLTSESKILDVGCGKGFMLYLLKNQLESGYLLSFPLVFPYLSFYVF
jgi:2-polyprenyl-3-methyl-5-hydroxy-6-metoxy-1,4-benzoquinol methylase